MKANKSALSKSVVPNKRYGHHHLSVLHTQYTIDFPDPPCSYPTFCRLWPSNVIKPTSANFSSCHCTSCENSASLERCLKKHNLITSDVDLFEAIKVKEEGCSEQMQTLMEEVAKCKNSDRKEEVVVYSVWEKVEKEIHEDEDTFDKENARKRANNKVDRKIQKSIKVEKLAEMCEQQFTELEAHLHRNKVIKQKIQAEKEKIMGDVTGRSAMCWVDWSQSLEMHQVREVQSAWFGVGNLSLQSGYLFHNTHSRGFGSFAKDSDKKVNVEQQTTTCDRLLLRRRASLRPILTALLEEGVTEVTFVSDSPVNQYRCVIHIHQILCAILNR
jgi:hypothetical protein